MALGDSYAAPEDLEGRLGKSDDGSFERLLFAASRQVEAFTGRQFNRADEEYPSARRFRALDSERVAVDDFHVLDELEVEVDGVPWDVDLYVDARPWNGAIAGVGWPYSDLFAVNRSWPWSRRANISVAAHWGWASVPAGIVEATLDVAEVLSLGRTGLSGAIRSETVGGYAVSYATPGSGYPENVPRELIKAVPYRRTRFGVA